MKLTINQILKQGNTAQQEGKSEEAEHFYREILKTQPTHPDANHNLGVVAVSKNRTLEALSLFKIATEANPNSEQFWISYGNVLINEKKYKEAEKSFKKVIELNPYNARAHNIRGTIVQILGKLDEAEVSYKKAIELEPDYVNSHCKLGVVLDDLGKFDEAEKSYRKAIELKPDYVQAYYNFGNLLKDIDRLDEAEASYKKAVELKPDYVAAHNNLGVILNNKGNLVAALDSYKQVLNIQPDYATAWQNIFFPLNIIKSQTSSAEDHLPLLDEQVTSKYAQAAKSILSYRLNLGSPLTESFLNKALSILSSADNTFINNPKISSSKLSIGSTPPKKITALVHFGRSGTGLMHSLIDGHPEVSTLPSIYFSEFFDHFSWEKIIAGGWKEMADRFAKTYEVLFDASSAIQITTIGNKLVDNMGRREGMTTVGTKKDEVISVNKKVFIRELKQLMDYHDRLDQFTFFKLVHSAYDKVLNDHNKKNLIFYHIHNPDNYAQLNFLRLAPNTNWLMMVREPVQSCESWVMNGFHDNDYNFGAHKIFQMLFEVDQAIYQNSNSVGVRLEDLKKHPKKTISALCNWLGIKENDSLYQMTAQGKKWWGDRGSPDFEKDGMNPFGKISINRKLGSIFSENDQYILRTLFYPFSVRFGYAEENLEKFKKDLQTIRPMLDQMFDFEKKIVQNKKMNTEKFMKSGSYLFLRSGMIERWNTLNKLHTYPNILTILNIN